MFGGLREIPDWLCVYYTSPTDYKHKPDANVTLTTVSK